MEDYLEQKEGRKWEITCLFLNTERSWEEVGSPYIMKLISDFSQRMVLCVNRETFSSVGPINPWLGKVLKTCGIGSLAMATRTEWAFVLLLFCAINQLSWSVCDLHETSKIYWISNSRPEVVPGHQEDRLEEMICSLNSVKGFSVCTQSISPPPASRKLQSSKDWLLRASDTSSVHTYWWVFSGFFDLINVPQKLTDRLVLSKKFCQGISEKTPVEELYGVCIISWKWLLRWL